MSNAIRIGPLRVAPEVRGGKPTGKWILDVPKSISRKGRRQRRFFVNREQAIEAAKLFQRQAYRGQVRPEQAVVSKLTLLQALTEWSEEQQLEVAAGNKRRSSLERDVNHFKSLKAFFRDAPLSDFTERRLMEYVAWRIKEGNSPATVKTDVVACGKLLRWAVNRDVLGSMPKLPKVRVPKPKIDPPTMEEICRIVGLLPDDLKAPIMLIAETGCRKGEALNLRWDDVDIERREIHIRSRDGWTVKTEHSERTLPLSEDMAAVLEELQGKGSEYVFPGKDPEGPRENIKTGFYTAVRKAGIKRGGKPLRVTVHTLRKAYATWAATEQKVHPAVLKRLLGHSPTSTVTDGWYVGVNSEALRIGVRAISDGRKRPSGSKVAADPKNQNGPPREGQAV